MFRECSVPKYLNTYLQVQYLDFQTKSDNMHMYDCWRNKIFLELY